MAVFQQLFEEESVREMCEEMYTSSEVVEGVLSSKMGMGRKLTMLKHLESMRRVAADPTWVRWVKE